MPYLSGAAQRRLHHTLRTQLLLHVYYSAPPDAEQVPHLLTGVASGADPPKLPPERNHRAAEGERTGWRVDVGLAATDVDGDRQDRYAKELERGGDPDPARRAAEQKAPAGGGRARGRSRDPPRVPPQDAGEEDCAPPRPRGGHQVPPGRHRHRLLPHCRRGGPRRHQAVPRRRIRHSRGGGERGDGGGGGRWRGWQRPHADGEEGAGGGPPGRPGGVLLRVCARLQGGRRNAAGGLHEDTLPLH
mmetsp:Transcript_15332/g.59927  ORF Transcript_15332/g.59927 Transcript_15332/m.59927 type:complete len:245 (+) Transcript_15332:149-883(+)